MVCDISALERSIQQYQLDIQEVRDMYERASMLHEYMSPAAQISTVPELRMLYSLESKLQELESLLQAQIQSVDGLRPALHIPELGRQRALMILGACMQRAATAGVR